jgi:hypothetical protein
MYGHFQIFSVYDHNVFIFVINVLYSPISPLEIFSLCNAFQIFCHYSIICLFNINKSQTCVYLIPIFV